MCFHVHVRSMHGFHPHTINVHWLNDYISEYMHLTSALDTSIFKVKAETANTNTLTLQEVVLGSIACYVVQVDGSRPLAKECISECCGIWWERTRDARDMEREELGAWDSVQSFKVLPYTYLHLITLTRFSDFLVFSYPHSHILQGWSRGGE